MEHKPKEKEIKRIKKMNIEEKNSNNKKRKRRSTNTPIKPNRKLLPLVSSLKVLSKNKG
jgi:hypothetical protein